MSDDARQPKLLSRETYIPIGVAIAVLVGAGSTVFNVAARLARIEYGIEDNSEELQRMRLELGGKIEDVESAAADRWTRRDHREWVERLRLTNPDLTIPEIER